MLAGVRSNRLYIFSHPELKDELREQFDYVLDQFPDGEGDPRRIEVEQRRRRGNAEARARADAVGDADLGLL